MLVCRGGMVVGFSYFQIWKLYGGGGSLIVATMGQGIGVDIGEEGKVGAWGLGAWGSGNAQYLNKKRGFTSWCESSGERMGWLGFLTWLYVALRIRFALEDPQLVDHLIGAVDRYWSTTSGYAIDCSMRFWSNLNLDGKA